MKLRCGQHSCCTVGLHLISCALLMQGCISVKSCSEASTKPITHVVELGTTTQSHHSHQHHKPVRYRILSIDAGGIRGVVPLVILLRLLQQYPQLIEQTDLIAGSSTGGIIAILLAYGVSVKEILEFYEDNGSAIFSQKLLHKLVSVDGWAKTRYSNKILAKLLQKGLGTTRLRDLKKRVLVPAFQLDNKNPDPNKRSWGPKFFHNFPNTQNGDELAYKVALRSSAAVPYFPSVDGYVDASLAGISDMSLLALSQSQDSDAIKHPPALDQVAVLSLGLGEYMKYIAAKDIDPGMISWIEPLLEILADGPPDVAQYQCRQLIGDNYHRIDFALPADRSLPIDDPSKIPQLEQIARVLDISPTLKWLARTWKPSAQTSTSPAAP
ncbi:MAG: patatin-like phospholipase family protein [Myxococcota bacterium]